MHSPAKPALRGWFHQQAFFLALVACGLLISRASHPRATWSAVVYSLSLVGLFGVSALYHRIHWDEARRKLMRRLDHTAIYLLIAGSSTPIGLLALEGALGERIVVLFWIAALLGILKNLVWLHSPKWVSAALYVAMGCLSLPFFPELMAALGPAQSRVFLAGGLTYVAGAAVYALKRPDPWPRTFGYHEIFHILVVVAAALQFAVIWQLVR